MPYTPTVIVDSDGKLYQKDTNNHYWRGSVSTTGVLTWTDTGTTAPVGTPIDSVLLSKMDRGVYVASPFDANLGSVSGTQVIDFANELLDVRVRLTLAGNVVLNLTNVPPLAVVSIRCQQASTGGPFTLTIQQSGATTAVKWDGGVVHVMSTTAGAVDVVAGQKAATNIDLNTVGKAYA